MIKVTEINIYPVKSLRGITLDQATVTTRGLKYDREWLIVDHNNKFLTQRETSAMATITTAINDTHLELRCDRMPRLLVDLDQPSKKGESVKIWRDRAQAVDQGIEASEWLTEALGKRNDKPLRLVRFAKNAERPVSSEYLDNESSEVAFADGYPYLVGIEESLELLNSRLNERVPMNRFRANIVIRGLDALQEHVIRELNTASNDISIGLRKPCDRCKMTTIDQRSGVVSEIREPLKTLIANNPFENLRGGYFGQNSILVKGDGQTLSVGDELIIPQ